MPDDFRGRAFALFDIAYNLGFIIPALILSVVFALLTRGGALMLLYLLYPQEELAKPLELTSPEDIDVALEVLTATLRRLSNPK